MSCQKTTNAVLQTIMNILPFSSIIAAPHQITKCNYNCPVCRASGSVPNMAGRFYSINRYECQCNGCNSIFLKKLFSSHPGDDSILYEKWEVYTKDSDLKSEVGTQPESVV